MIGTLNEDAFDEGEPLDTYGLYRVEYNSVMNRITVRFRQALSLGGRK